jgi:hypothetical protein
MALTPSQVDDRPLCNSRQAEAIGHSARQPASRPGFVGGLFLGKTLLTRLIDNNYNVNCDNQFV